MKFAHGLDFMRNKPSVIIKRKGRERAGDALRLLPSGDMYRLECHTGFLGSSFQQRDIFGGKGTLTGIIQRETGGKPWYDLADTGLETGFLHTWEKGKIAKLKIRLSHVRNLKSLILQVFRVGKEAHLLF